MMDRELSFSSALALGLIVFAAACAQPDRRAAPPPHAPARALLAADPDGTFWVPVRGEFTDEDLLLMPDGHFITHLHERPSSSGTFDLDGTTLTLHGWMGDGTFEISALRVNGTTLEGVALGKPLVMRRENAR